MTSRPHDALFKSGFESPADAALLLRWLLPAAVGDAVAWDTLERERGSFIDPKLADQHSDLLFRARLRAGRCGPVFLLLEHQSTRDPTMPQRMLSYQTRIWARFRKERRRAHLPPVLAVLVSHARHGWTAPRAFEELFDPDVLAIPGLAPLVPRCSMIVLDLARLTHAELQARSLPAIQKLALWLLRDVRDPETLLASFNAWAPVVREAGQTRAGLDALYMLMGYMIRAGGPVYQVALRAKIRTLVPFSEDATMTTYVMLEEKDLVKARIETLRNQLRYKFKALDAAYEARLQSATSKAVDRYLLRVLTADSLAEVFEGRSRRRAPRPRSRGSRPVRHRRAQARPGR